MGELSFGENCFIEMLKVDGEMYIIHCVNTWGTRSQDYDASFYLVDNEREALEKFLEEIEKLQEETGIELETCSIDDQLKSTLAKYREFPDKSPRLERIVEKTSSLKEIQSSITPRYSTDLAVLEGVYSDQFRKELGVSQDLLDRTKELIMAYQPHIPATNVSTVIGTCLLIAHLEKKRDVDDRRIAAILHLERSSIRNAYRRLSLKVRLPKLESKEERTRSRARLAKQIQFNEELKHYEPILRELVSQGKSFYFISNNLNVEPRKLRRLLKKLKLECSRLGWGA